MNDFATLVRHRFDHSSGNLEHQTGKRNDKVKSIRCGAFLVSTPFTSNQLLFRGNIRRNNTDAQNKRAWTQPKRPGPRPQESNYLGVVRRCCHEQLIERLCRRWRGNSTLPDDLGCGNILAINSFVPSIVGVHGCASQRSTGKQAALCS